MKVLWRLIIFCLMSVDYFVFSMSRSDLNAVNSIEKELRVIINSKSIDWQKRAQQLIDQLENQYVVRGYNKDNIQNFKKQLQEPVRGEPVNNRDVYAVDEQQIVQKERIEQALDDLMSALPDEFPQERNEQLSSALFELAAVDRAKAQEYFEKINVHREPISQACVVDCGQQVVEYEQKIAEYGQRLAEYEQKITQCEQKRESEQFDSNVPDSSVIDYSAIVSKLDDLMAVSAERKNELWERDVNALLFDLSRNDIDKAQNYMKRIYVRADSIPVSQPPSSGIPQPPSAGVPKPPAGGPPTPPLGGVPKPPSSGIPLPPSAGVPKPPAGGPPTPPSGGMPMPSTGGPKPPALPGGKPAQPKPIVMTLAALNKLSESELLALFDTHLSELKNEWNGMSEKRVEVKTKYGSRIEIVRGEPSSGWNNKVDTIRKSLVNRNIMSASDVDQKIQNRIDQVRAEKKTALPSGGVVSEKPAEEVTQKSVEQQLKILFSNPKLDEMSWLVGVKSGIKNLNTFDHAAALKYQEDFIGLLPKEKRFIKP